TPRTAFFPLPLHVALPILKRLTDEFGSAERIVSTPARELCKLGLSEAAVDAICHPDEAAIAYDLRWLSGCENHLIHPQSEYWPEDRKSTRLNSSHVKISYA